MKKLVLALAMTLLAGSAWADGYHRHVNLNHPTTYLGDALQSWAAQLSTL